MRRIWLLSAMVAILVGACGASPATGAPSTGPTAAPTDSGAPQGSASGPGASAGATDAAASLEAGTIRYRVVNLSGDAVDVYIRTQGAVHAAPAALGVASGTVTADFFPPEPGTVVVATAGDKNPTCVIDCTFLAESSTNAGEGNQRTIVVYSASSTEFWENPEATSVGAAVNALAPADPTKALLSVYAEGVTDANFGLKLAFKGVAGCQKDFDGTNFLIGGTQLVRFAFDPAGVDAVLHGNNDRTCSAAPAGGPFKISGATGSRTFLLLWGTIGSMQGVVVPIP